MGEAKAGDIVLLFVDESDFLNVPYLARVWASQGRDLRVEAPGTHAAWVKVKKRCVSGARDSATTEMVAHVGTTKRTSDFLSLLGLVDARYGPVAGEERPAVVIVSDNGPSHTSPHVV